MNTIQQNNASGSVSNILKAASVPTDWITSDDNADQLKKDIDIVSSRMIIWRTLISYIGIDKIFNAYSRYLSLE